MSEYEMETRLEELDRLHLEAMRRTGDELEQVKAESEGRLKVLLEKAEALREADIRVMNLEAERDRLAAEVATLRDSLERRDIELKEALHQITSEQSETRALVHRYAEERSALQREVARLTGWQHTSFCSAQPDGTLLCPVCDQSEVVGHAPDCCAALWAKTYHENQMARLMMRWARLCEWLNSTDGQIEIARGGGGEVRRMMAALEREEAK